MENTSRPRVFIGSGEASLLERKTLIHSLRANSRSDLELYVFNGTHNAVEPLDGRDPFPAPMSLKAKYSNVTEFSNYRFLIPHLCGYQGRAIYVDSDMIALGDIAELFSAPMNGNAMLAKKDAYGGGQDAKWGLSVTLFDCAQCQFDLDLYVAEIANKRYTMTDLHQMTPAFQQLHPFAIGAIDPNWNVFDFCDSNTKLIHYTNLLSQPWKFPGHPFEELWFTYFRDARAAGIITEQDISLSLVRAYVRQDIANPNSASGSLRGLAQRVRRRIRRALR